MMRTTIQSGPSGMSLCYETDFFPLPDIFTFLLGAFVEASLAHNMKHTSIRPFSATQTPVFMCDISPSAVCSSASAEAVFFCVLFYSVVSIHSRRLCEFKKTSLRICELLPWRTMEIKNKSCCLHPSLPIQNQSGIRLFKLIHSRFIG